MKITDEIKIEDFQNFEQYMNINPINIQIIDLEIQTKLLFYSKVQIYCLQFIIQFFNYWKYKGYFITTNGLKDTKGILINGQIFQGIGVIYISEIENWEKIKEDSHWTNVILTDSTYPIPAKHFPFGFETTVCITYVILNIH